MVTLKEVIDKGVAVKQAVRLFGAVAEFLQENEQLFQAIGEAICQEQGVSPDEALMLPKDTVLGPEAEARFREWLHQSRPVFV